MKETKEEPTPEAAAPETKGEPPKRKARDPTRQRKRRRNYDENDAQVEGEKPVRDGAHAHAHAHASDGDGDGDDDGDDDDDAKLDTLAALEDEEEDDLAEIDTGNIIATGRRTRGKVIDYKKTAQQLPPRQADEDDESDEDFRVQTEP